MVQKIDLKHMPTKSRAWIEAERLKLARGCLGGNNPLRRNQTTAPERYGRNWKVADIVPQPSLLVVKKCGSRSRA